MPSLGDLPELNQGLLHCRQILYPLSLPRKSESESETRPVVSDSLPMNCSPRNSPGQNTGVGSLSLLQGIFSTQELNPGLPHSRWILYQLSQKGSPSLLKEPINVVPRVK